MAEAYQFSRANRTVWWPVTVRVPVDGGGVKEFKFELQIQLRKKAEKKALRAMSEADQEKDTKSRALGWRGTDGNEHAMFDVETRQPIPFTPENFDALLEDEYFETAISVAMIQAEAGAAVKN